jgi:hypothetical protein
MHTPPCKGAVWNSVLRKCYLKSDVCDQKAADPGLQLLIVGQRYTGGVHPGRRTCLPQCKGYWQPCTAKCEGVGQRVWMVTRLPAPPASPCPAQSPPCAAGDGGCSSPSRLRATQAKNELLPVWTDRKLVYVVAILSARRNTERRNTSRHVWIPELRARSVALGIPTRTLFVIGSAGSNAHSSSTAAEDDAALLAEQQRNRDIMFVDVEDTYQSSSVKMLGFYRELRARFRSRCVPAAEEAGCPQQPFVALIKLDDDAAILPTAVESLASADFLRPLRATGPRWQANFRACFVPHREGTWAVSRTAWPGDVWPPFGAGAGHLMNWALADWLGAHAQSLPSSVWMGKSDLEMCSDFPRVCRDRCGGSCARMCGCAEDVAHGIWFDAAARGRPVVGQSAACRLFDDRWPATGAGCSATSITTGAVMAHGGRHDRDQLAATVAAYRLMATGSSSSTGVAHQVTSTLASAIRSTCASPLPNLTRIDSHGSSRRLVAREIVQSLKRSADALASSHANLSMQVCANLTVALAAVVLSAHNASAMHTKKLELLHLRRLLTVKHRDSIEVCGPSEDLHISVLDNNASGAIPLAGLFANETTGRDAGRQLSAANCALLCSALPRACDDMPS